MNETRREPLLRGRRIALTITLDPQVLAALGVIGEGNRSKAVETLVKWYLAAPIAPDLPIP